MCPGDSRRPVILSGLSYNKPCQQCVTSAQSSTHFLPVQKQPSVAGMTYGGLQKESSPSLRFAPPLAGLSRRRGYDSSDCRIGLLRQSGPANRAAFCHCPGVTPCGQPVTRHHTSRRRDSPVAAAGNRGVQSPDSKPDSRRSFQRGTLDGQWGGATLTLTGGH